MGKDDKQQTGDVLGSVPLMGQRRLDLATYTPHHLTPEEWARVRPFVLSQLAVMGDLHAIETRTPPALSRLAAWAVAQGLPLDVETVLHPDNVNRYLADAETELATRTLSAYRWALNRAGRELTRDAPWTPKPKGWAAHDLAEPYTRIQERRLWRDAEQQSTWLRRRVAAATLAVGLGCGLRPGEVQRLKDKDVIETPDALVVQVGSRNKREVPVAFEYASRVAYFANDALNGNVVVAPGNKDGLNRVIRSMRWGRGTPALDVRRLRSTWVVRCIERGVRLPELTVAAGVKHPDAFRSLLRYVEPLSDSERRRMLAGVE